MYFLGMDAGGSKTECAVGDESTVLGRATAPSCKIQAVGEERARVACQQGVREACAAAGIVPTELTAVCVGIAGVSRSDIAARLRAMIAEVTPARVTIVGDNVIAMEAAFGVGPGVVVIAGTGSIAHGRNGAGEEARAGGWGAAVSDEGSGGWIGRRAVAAALRARDRGEPTRLIETIEKAWQVKGPEELARVANQAPPPDFAALFPLVLAAAQARDALAGEVLMRAGAELAQLARIVMDRLWPLRAAERVRVR